MRWNYRKKHQWHKWFCWYPINDSKNWYWLESVDRRKKDGKKWEYRRPIIKKSNHQCSFVYSVAGTKKLACSCGKQKSPFAGSIQHKSSTPTWKWEKAQEMLEKDPKTTVVAIKNELGVTYKTAWRIKQLLND